MQDGVHFARHKNIVRYIAFIKGKVLIIREVGDIIRAACDEIIHADNFMSIR